MRLRVTADITQCPNSGFLSPLLWLLFPVSLSFLIFTVATMSYRAFLVGAQKPSVDTMALSNCACVVRRPRPGAALAGSVGFPAPPGRLGAEPACLRGVARPSSG